MASTVLRGSVDRPPQFWKRKSSLAHTKSDLSKADLNASPLHSSSPVPAGKPELTKSSTWPRDQAFPAPDTGSLEGKLAAVSLLPATSNAAGSQTIKASWDNTAEHAAAVTSAPLLAPVQTPSSTEAVGADTPVTAKARTDPVAAEFGSKPTSAAADGFESSAFSDTPTKAAGRPPLPVPAVTPQANSTPGIPPRPTHRRNQTWAGSAQPGDRAHRRSNSGGVPDGLITGNETAGVNGAHLVRAISSPHGFSAAPSAQIKTPVLLKSLSSRGMEQSLISFEDAQEQKHVYKAVPTPEGKTVLVKAAADGAEEEVLLVTEAPAVKRPPTPLTSIPLDGYAPASALPPHLLQTLSPRGSYPAYLPSPGVGGAPTSPGKVTSPGYFAGGNPFTPPVTPDGHLVNAPPNTPATAARRGGPPAWQPVFPAPEEAAVGTTPSGAQAAPANMEASVPATLQPAASAAVEFSAFPEAAPATATAAQFAFFPQEHSFGESAFEENAFAAAPVTVAAPPAVSAVPVYVAAPVSTAPKFVALPAPYAKQAATTIEFNAFPETQPFATQGLSSDTEPSNSEEAVAERVPAFTAARRSTSTGMEAAVAVVRAVASAEPVASDDPFGGSAAW